MRLRMGIALLVGMGLVWAVIGAADSRLVAPRVGTAGWFGTVSAAGPCDGVTQVPRSECEALVKLYNTTGGSSWISRTGWLANNTPCDWFGVDCESGHVTHLYLFSNHLSGTIPVSVTELAYLKWLQLSTNDLSGAIPPQLGRLSRLEALHLFDNRLDGTIPVSLGDLANLQTMDLSMNPLTGAIPASLGRLSLLRWLDLSSLQLGGSIPSELGSLSQLGTLLLANNALEGNVPASLAGLPNLGTGLWGRLDVAYNMLSSPDPTVRAFLEARNPGWAATQTVPPTGVRIVDRQTHTITLGWTPISYTADSGYYEIEFAENLARPYAVIGRTADKTGNGYVATDLQDDTRYYFTVRARTRPHDDQVNDLWSAYTAPISGTTLAVTEPIAGLAAFNNGPMMLGGGTRLWATIAQGTGVNYAWSFGDGSVGAGMVITHTYGAVGAYNAIVTAINSFGSASARTTVTITDVPIQGLALVSDSPVRIGQAVHLTATVTAGSNVIYTWALGDGTTAVGPTAAHTYASPGDYAVVVTATNSVGWMTTGATVTVVPLAPLHLPLVRRS